MKLSYWEVVALIKFHAEKLTHGQLSFQDFDATMQRITELRELLVETVKEMKK